MALEIERKFLVVGDAWRQQAHKTIAMRHGYLAPLGSKASVRVRVEGPADIKECPVDIPVGGRLAMDGRAGAGESEPLSRQGGQAIGVLNVKAAVIGAARAEYEYTIPADEAEEMINTLANGVILKTRHYVQHQGHLWEVDEFEGDNAPLVVAEIELGHEAESFARPEWLGEEVTMDARYYNHALSVTPYQQWPQPK